MTDRRSDLLALQDLQALPDMPDMPDMPELQAPLGLADVRAASEAGDGPGPEGAGVGPGASPDASPEFWLAAGFGHHVRRWSARAGADPATAAAAGAAAQAVSLATRQGHACLHLRDLAEPREGMAPAADGTPHDQDAQRGPGAQSVDRWRATLLACGVVGLPGQPAAFPLILDSGDRLYLQRYFDLEQRLARRLRRAATAVDRAQRGPALEPAAGSAPEAVDWQRLAVALALRGRLTVISGGPGTGKTHTVVRILASLLQAAPDARIALTAPTGKAAARLTESIRRQTQALPAGLRDRLPSASTTVHRLLGWRGGGGFAHDAEHPLPLDALVVDEASMLDLALATRLLEAVPDHARIVMLGDKDQLAAVEAGAVFAELCLDPTLTPACVADLAAATAVPAADIVPAKPLQAGAIADCVVWLRHSHRFKADSGIGRLATLINEGQDEAALQWLQGDSPSNIVWLGGEEASLPVQAVARIEVGLGPLVQAVHRALRAPVERPTDGAEEAPVEERSETPADGPHRGPSEPVTAQTAFSLHQALSHFRVLCAVREGPRGVDSLNATLTRAFRRQLGPLDSDPASPWYPGRPVMVTRNDATLQLFNGDVGVTLPDAQGRPLVHFPTPEGGWRAWPPAALPPHETAWAMTAHKAQGSEFDEVVVVLPQRPSRVLTRELLYTAVTRARHGLVLVAHGPVLRQSIRTRTQRHSGLADRLQEVSSGA